MRWFVLLMMCAGAYAQTPAPFIPDYVVGTGVSYDYYGKTGFAANTEIGIHVKGGTFSYTSLEMTATTATLRTGAAIIAKQVGYWALIGLADAGLATGSGSTVGSFSGGALISYDVGARVTKGVQHFYINVGARVLALTGTNVNPIFEITFMKGF